MNTYNFATNAFNFGELDKQLQKIMLDYNYKMPCFATSAQMKKYAFWSPKKGSRAHSVTIKKKNGIVLNFKVFNIEQCNYTKNLDGNTDRRNDIFNDIPIPVPYKASSSYLKELQKIAYSLQWCALGNTKSHRKHFCDPVMAKTADCEIIKLNIEQVIYNRQCYKEELERQTKEAQLATAEFMKNKFKGYGAGA